MSGLRPDIALVPIGGLFAMDWRAGAKAVGYMKAAIAIPKHYNMFLGGCRAGRRFAGAVGAGGLVLPRFRGNLRPHAYN
jgi:L-ascorbate metabolism protein UlaG (beta-lactamase superfamily)